VGRSAARRPVSSSTRQGRFEMAVCTGGHVCVDGAKFCTVCGGGMSVPAPGGSPIVASGVVAAPMMVGAPVAMVLPAKNSIGTAGMVCAIVAAAISPFPGLNFFSFPLAMLGLIFGAVGLSRSKTLPGQLGRGQAIAALVLSIIGLALPIIFLVAAAGAVASIAGGTAASNAHASGVSPAKIFIPLLLLVGGGYYFWRRGQNLTPTLDSVSATANDFVASVQRKCTSGHDLAENARFCGVCGGAPESLLQRASKACSNGHAVEDAFTFCGQCGAAAV